MALRTPARTSQFAGDETTAAVAVDLGNKQDQRYIRSTVAHSRATGARSWDWFDKITEVHYAISRDARIAGYADLRCVRYAPDGSIEDTVDDGLAADVVAAISSPFGGVRGLVERFYTLMKVPGDSYLLDVVDSDGDSEGFHFLSPDEMDVSSFSHWRPGKGQLRWVTAPQLDGDQSRFVRDIANQDLLGRVWAPSKRYVDLTDSALRAMDDECEALYLLTKSIKAKLMSRFALAGIMYLPNSVSTARVRKNQTQVAGQKIDDTLNFLITAMTRNVKTWDDATAYLPIMLRGPDDAGEKIKHIVMDREVFETDLNLRVELINRILQGLDSNQDMTTGTANQSHWSAWSASDDERRVAIQPDIEQMCWALTRLVLHRQLQKDGMSPEEILRHGVWFDLSRAATKSNQQEDARQLRDRGLITGAATREMSGIDENVRLEGDEYIRWVGTFTKNPMLMTYGLDEYETIDWDAVAKMPAKTGPAPDSPGGEPRSQPGEGDPGSPDDNETDTPRTQRPG